jgi:hypothetical protein
VGGFCHGVLLGCETSIHDASGVDYGARWDSGAAFFSAVSRRAADKTMQHVRGRYLPILFYILKALELGAQQDIHVSQKKSSVGFYLHGARHGRGSSSGSFQSSRGSVRGRAAVLLDNAGMTG